MIRFWANQHGQGVVVDGEHRVLIERSAHLLGITPEEFLDRAIRWKTDEVLREQA